MRMQITRNEYPDIILRIIKRRKNAMLVYVYLLFLAKIIFSLHYTHIYVYIFIYS